MRQRDTCSCAQNNTCLRASTECGTNLTVISAPALALNQLTKNPDVAGQVAPGALPITCSTGEDVTSFPAKFDRLYSYHENAAVAPVGSATRNAMVERMKRIYETTGISLSADQRQRARTLYTRYRLVEPTCGRASPTNLPACTADGNASLGFASLCTRLLSGHVGPSLVGMEYSACTAYLAHLSQLSAGNTCAVERPAYLASAVSIHRELQRKIVPMLGEELALMREESGAEVVEFDPTVIAHYLRFISDWYEPAKGIMEPEQLQQELDRFTSNFWSAAHGHTLQSMDGGVTWQYFGVYGELDRDYRAAKSQLEAAQADGGSTQQAREALERAVGLSERRGMALDRAVLNAAYGDTSRYDEATRTHKTVPALANAPLVRITADALGSLVQRGDALSEYHDVGCALTECPGAAASTPMSRLWDVLAHLDVAGGTAPDGSAITSLQDVLTGVPDDLAGWKPAFQQLASRQTRLVTALAETGGAEVPRGDLATLRDQAESRSARFKETGLFAPAAGNDLNSGVHSEHRQRVLDNIRERGASLTNDKTLLDQQLFSLVDALVRVNDNAASSAQLRASLANLESGIQELKKKEAAYIALTEGRGTGGDEDHTADKLLAAWSRISQASNPNAYLSLGATQEFFLSGADARFRDWQTQTVADIGTQPIPIVVAAGTDPSRIVSVSVDPGNQWSPTCALRTASVIDPVEARNGGGAQSFSTVVVPTGPEGYGLSWTGTDYKAHSSSNAVTTRLTVGARFENCLASPPNLLGGTASACVYADLSVSGEHAESWSSGDQQTTTAQFTGGLYIKSTPFQAPAGSLLLVQLPAGGPQTRDRIIDVHVIRGPQTTIPISQSSNLYLVVNDTSCAEQDPSLQLHVTVGTFVHAGDAAKGLVQRMAKTASLVRARRDELRQRLEFLPSEVASIERQAKLDQVGVPGEVQLTVEQYPLALQDLFYAFLSREVLLLEAEVRLWNIQHELELREREYRAGMHVLLNGEASGSLVGMLPRWTTRGMRLDFLREASRSYAQNMRHYVVPLLRLWYPTVRNDLRTSTAASSLTRVDMNTDLGVLLGSLSTLASDIDLKLSTAALPYRADSDLGRPFVAFRFARPDQLDTSCTGIPSARCHRRGELQTFRWATDGQTRALWASISNPDPNSVATRRLTFSVQPEDLYAYTGDAVLNCLTKLPVVRQMGLVLTNFSTVPSGASTVTGRVSDVGQYVAEDGIHEFRMANPAWLALPSVPVLHVLNYSVTPTTPTVEQRLRGTSQDTRGISPFGTFEFDIEERALAAWQFSSATTIDLVMVLEYVGTQSGNPVPVSACLR